MRYMISLKVNKRWVKLSVSFKAKPSDFDVMLYRMQYAQDHQLNPDAIEYRVEHIIN